MIGRSLGRWPRIAGQRYLFALLLVILHSCLVYLADFWLIGVQELRKKAGKVAAGSKPPQSSSAPDLKAGALAITAVRDGGGAVPAGPEVPQAAPVRAASGVEAPGAAANGAAKGGDAAAEATKLPSPSRTAPEV